MKHFRDRRVMWLLRPRLGLGLDFTSIPSRLICQGHPGHPCPCLHQVLTEVDGYLESLHKMPFVGSLYAKLSDGHPHPCPAPGPAHLMIWGHCCCWLPFQALQMSRDLVVPSLPRLLIKLSSLPDAPGSFLSPFQLLLRAGL